jgi:glycosyltransferase involved in cell wall biosynthesis
MSRPRAFLAAVGDVNDPITWSGTPYYFLQSARPAGLLDEGLPLSVQGKAWQARRLLWNGWRWMTQRGRGGYQYSVPFLEKLWKPYLPRLLDQTVVNCFQLFPPSLVEQRRVRKVYYIDMTLRQLFEEYQQRGTVGSAIAKEALAREKEGYQAAELVVCHSHWAARSVIQDYGIDVARVKSVVPGANLDRDAYRAWDQKTPPRQTNSADPNAPLRLIFIGKYWHRKGLDRLCDALQLVQQQKVPFHLQVLGCRQEDLPLPLRHTPHVEWLGFIDKRRETERFLQLVANADVGCLLSRAEAGGMALREYHALGLVVMGPAVGGAPEHLFADAGKAFGPDDPPAAIAEWLVKLRQNPEDWKRLRERAWQRRHEALWDHTVQQWHAFWPTGT